MDEHTERSTHQTSKSEKAKQELEAEGRSYSTQYILRDSTLLDTSGHDGVDCKCFSKSGII